MGWVGREGSSDLKTIVCSVGVSHLDRVPGCRFEVRDDNLRPWQGVILYRAVAFVSLSGIKSEQGKMLWNGVSKLGSCNLLVLGGQIVRDPSITVFYLCNTMKVSVRQLASFHSAKWTFKLFSVDSTNLIGSTTVASRHGSEGFKN